MLLPILVDVAGHLQHAAGDDLRIKTVVGQIVAIVTIGAALFRRDPLGYRQHYAIELVRAEIVQDFHVLVNGCRPSPSGEALSIASGKALAACNIRCAAAVAI